MNRLELQDKIREVLLASPELQRACDRFMPPGETRQGQVAALYHAGWHEGMTIEEVVRLLASLGQEEYEVLRWRTDEARRPLGEED